MGARALTLALPGVASVGMGAAMGVRRSLEMPIDAFDAALTALLAAAHGGTAPLPALHTTLPVEPLARFVLGTLSARIPPLHDLLDGRPRAHASDAPHDATVDAIPRNGVRPRSLAWHPSEPSRFAVPLCCLAGRMSPVAAARSLLALPSDGPVLIELVALDLAVDTVVQIVRRRRAPMIAVCRGALRGEGARLLLDAATCAIADRSCTLHWSAHEPPSLGAAADADAGASAGAASPPVAMARLVDRRGHAPLSWCTADEGMRRGWLDEVHASSAVGARARQLSARLAQAPAALL